MHGSIPEQAELNEAKVGMQRDAELAAEVGDEPEKQGKADADEDGGGNRKVERGVFAAMEDVARQAAESEGQATMDVEDGTDSGQDQAEDQESAAEIAGGVHGRSFRKKSNARTEKTENTERRY
jgi:hypothetical protein